MDSENNSSSSSGMRKHKNYDEDLLNCAVNEVKEKKIKIQLVSKRYSIPISTIRDKLAGKHNKALGASTLLSSEEELKIIQWIIKSSARGYPVTRFDLLEVAKQIINTTGDRSGKSVFKYTF